MKLKFLMVLTCLQLFFFQLGNASDVDKIENDPCFSSVVPVPCIRPEIEADYAIVGLSSASSAYVMESKGDKMSSFYCKVAGVTYRSNNGEKWIAINEKLPNENVNTLQALYGYLYAGTDEGVFVTKNGGKNWQDFGLLYNKISVLYAANGYLYAGLEGGKEYGVYEFNIVDNRYGWKGIGNTKDLIDKKILALASWDNYLFAGTDEGVYRINLSCGSWDKMAYPDAKQAVALQVEDGYLYAGTYGGGVFRSSDYGETWVAVNNGLDEPKVNCYGVSKNPIKPIPVDKLEPGLLARSYDAARYNTEYSRDWLWQLFHKKGCK